VTKFVPENGPQGGGTLVELYGTNLGRSGDDIISIELAGVECSSYDYLNRCNSKNCEP